MQSFIAKPGGIYVISTEI